MIATGMLPENNTLKDIEQVHDQPSLTYKLDFENKRIQGYTAFQDALDQAIILMTSVERNKYEIYNSDYGIEINDLMGKPMDYVLIVLESRIKDACSIDERILDMYDFDLTVDYDTVIVNFKLKSIYSEEEERELVFDGILANTIK